MLYIGKKEVGAKKVTIFGPIFSVVLCIDIWFKNQLLGNLCNCSCCSVGKKNKMLPHDQLVWPKIVGKPTPPQA